MLEKVIENWTSRLDYTRGSRCSPMPEIIFKTIYSVANWLDQDCQELYEKKHFFHAFCRRPLDCPDSHGRSRECQILNVIWNNKNLIQAVKQNDKEFIYNSRNNSNKRKRVAAPACEDCLALAATIGQPDCMLSAAVRLFFSFFIKTRGESETYKKDGTDKDYTTNT
ncbi:hypothetical protein TNCV_696181 [Trichonephila clavipes]|nr:hypothetical protein TNCV_696181 [Trichonephila clavipes]